MKRPQWTLLLPLLLLCASRAHANEDVAIAYLTDCSMYSDWQTVGMAFSYRVTEQPGSIKRVMCCTDQERKRYNEQLLTLMATHVAPSFTINPRTGDNYAAYNKPGAVVDWMAKAAPEEQWVLILDSDMLLRNKFHPNNYNTSRGWAASAPYTYLIGSANELWTRHIPNVAARNDTLAGPYGRHADQVGGFFFMHRDDMKRVAPLWLSTTEEVREDPEAWRLSGDQYVQKGGKPWISEMYGYVFGAAKADVWHRWHRSTMLYPSYNPPGIPKVMHYGLLFSVDDYQFDKHWHYDFDVTVCPPWEMPFGRRSKAGIFEPPPWPTTLRSFKSKGKLGGSDYYRDLLSLETITTLNAAFCDFHLRHCPPSQQLLDVCTMATTHYMEVQAEIEVEETHYRCKDSEPRCRQWATQGECEKNVAYMQENCRDACGMCAHLSEIAPRPPPTDTLRMLQQLASTLGVEMPTHSPENPAMFMPGKRIADVNNGAVTQQTMGQVETSPGLGNPNHMAVAASGAAGGAASGAAGGAIGAGTAGGGNGVGVGIKEVGGGVQAGNGVGGAGGGASSSGGQLQRGGGSGGGAGRADGSGGGVAPSQGARGLEQQQQRRQQEDKQPENELNLERRTVVQPGQKHPEASQPQSKDGQSGGNGEGGPQQRRQQPAATAPKSKSALLMRCYRMSLKLEEVKACVEAARKHVEWVQPPTGMGSIEDALDGQGVTQGLTVSGGTPQPVVRPHSRKLVLPSKDDGDAAKAADDAASGSRDGGVLPKTITWQVYGVWLLAIVVFCGAMPRFCRMRKRSRAFRSE